MKAVTSHITSLTKPIPQLSLNRKKIKIIPKKMSHMVFSNLSPLPPSTILPFTDYGDFCMLFRGSEFSVSQKYPPEQEDQYQKQGCTARTRRKITD